MDAYSDTLNAVGATLAARRVRELLEAKPKLSAAQLLAVLEMEADRAEDKAEQSRRVEEATCRRCGKGVIRSQFNDRWTHADNDRSYGCRAASFTSEEGWDESLPRSWKATRW